MFEFAQKTLNYFSLISQGRHWSEQRRTTLKTLRDFGFGRLSMEETVQEEVQKFLNFLR